MNGLPYYKAYPRDFFEGTAGMTVELKGIYRLVLDLIYMQGGALVDDPRYIAGHLGASVRTWTTARAKLIEAGKIFVIDGLVRNYRADKEQLITKSFLDKQRINGATPKKNKGLTEAVAKPKASHTEPDTDIRDTDVSLIPASRAKRGSRLSESWTIPKPWGEWAVAEGWPEPVIRTEADKFRDYWISRTGKDATKADWLATWRNWMRNCKAPKIVNGDTHGKPSKSEARFAAFIAGARGAS